MISRKLIIPVIAAVSLSLAACGNQDEKKNETMNAEHTTHTMSISSGAKEMKSALSDLQSQLADKNAVKVKTSAEKLEETWQTFEDDVKDKDAGLYGKVESPLSIIEAGSKTASLDVPVLTKAAKELDGVLTDVQKIK